MSITRGHEGAHVRTVPEHGYRVWSVAKYRFIGRYRARGVQDNPETQKAGAIGTRGGEPHECELGLRDSLGYEIRLSHDDRFLLRDHGRGTLPLRGRRSDRLDGLFDDATYGLSDDRWRLIHERDRDDAGRDRCNEANEDGEKDYLRLRELFDVHSIIIRQKSSKYRIVSSNDINGKCERANPAKDSRALWIESSSDYTCDGKCAQQACHGIDAPESRTEPRREIVLTHHYHAIEKEPYGESKLHAQKRS